jgi:hypothetical protein
MAPEPVSYRLSQMIAEADQAIQETDHALAPHRAGAPGVGNKPVPKELLSQYYRLHQHRHALELQRTYPQAVILTDVRFTSIMGADGQEIPLRVKKGEGRIADAAIVYGDRVWLIEEKVLDEVLRAFPKSAPARREAQKIVPSSSAGTQLANELKILKQAGRKGMLLGMTGVPVLGGPRIDLLPPVDNIAPSRLQVYRNMGDGPQVPQVPPTRAMPGAGAPLRPHDIVLNHGVPNIRAINVPPAPHRGGVLQPPVDLRGITGNPPGGRGDNRPPTGSGRDRWRWPTTTTGGGSGLRPQASTTTQRARRGAGGAAAAIQQISQGLSEKRNQIVFDRARRAAAEPEVWRQVQKLRHMGSWVLVKAVFWHSQPTIADSADVRFNHIQVWSLADPKGEKDEESARDSSSWTSPAVFKARAYHGEARDMPKNYHASSIELNFYEPEPEFEVFVEDIPEGKFGMGRCVRRKLR